MHPTVHPSPDDNARVERLAYLLARHHFRQALPHIHAVGGNLAEVPAARERAAAITALTNRFILDIQAELKAVDVAQSAAQAA